MKRKQQQEPRKPQRDAPDDFCEWWNPSGIDQPSGAARGGHPDAKRVWARKDAGRWTRRIYGLTAAQAWLVERYQKQYEAWVDAGRPEQPQGPFVAFVSIAASVERQQELWREMGTEVVKVVPQPNERERRKLLQKQKVMLLADKAKPVQGKVIEKGDDDDGPIPF